MIDILTKFLETRLKELGKSGFFGDVANFLFYPS
jgi:hypothetical protein